LLKIVKADAFEEKASKLSEFFLLIETLEKLLLLLFFSITVVLQNGETRFNKLFV
jgi:hypothetical protein